MIIPKLTLEQINSLYEEGRLHGRFNIAHEDYHKCPGINSSFLIDAQDYSLAHAKYWSENQTSPSKAMQEGTLFHTALLEPEQMEVLYKVVPTVDKRTKEGKAIWEIARIEGYTPITQETMNKVTLIRKSLMSSEMGRSLLGNVLVEQSFFWRDPDTDLLCRAKADIVNEKYKLLIDLKKTADGRLWNIKKCVQNYGYKLQASFYQDGINLAMGREVVNATVLIFIESEAPHGVRFVEAKKEWLQQGFDMYKEQLAQYKNAIESGIFSGYSDQIITIDEKE